MLTALLINGGNEYKSVDVNADSYIISDTCLMMFNGDREVAEFKDEYVVGVYESVPIKCTMDTKGVVFEPCTTTEGDQ